MSNAGKEMLARIQQEINDQLQARADAHAELNAQRERVMSLGAQTEQINSVMQLGCAGEMKVYGN